MKPRWSVNRKAALLGVMCAAALVVEAYLIFGSHGADFRIAGHYPYEITEFSKGNRVAHAFLMRGDGLEAISVRFTSDVRTHAAVHWTLWRGTLDEPTTMSRAFESTEAIDLRPGPQWKRFNVTRDASSRDRWYTFEIQLAAEQPPGARPTVALMASRDNPERGGVLWVDGQRKLGSLFLRVGRDGRTLYRRFKAEAEPNLPALLRMPAVQYALAAAIHAAFVVFAFATIYDSDGSS